MEPKFVSQFHVTMEMYKEWGRHPLGKNAVKNRKKVIGLRVFLACLGNLIILMGVLLSEFFYVIVGLFALIMALLRLFVLPDRLLGKQYDMIAKSQNGDSFARTITFADEIISEAGNMTTRYSYSEIVRIQEDSNYFYLFYNEDMVLRIPKGNFTVGTVEEFRDFCNSIVRVQFIN